jgi:hypothetical protein
MKQNIAGSAELEIEKGSENLKVWFKDHLLSLCTAMETATCQRYDRT